MHFANLTLFRVRLPEAAYQTREARWFLQRNVSLAAGLNSPKRLARPLYQAALLYQFSNPFSGRLDA